jgi:hypothetical protein
LTEADFFRSAESEKPNRGGFPSILFFRAEKLMVIPGGGGEPSQLE